MVASQSQPNAVSGSLVGTPTSATKRAKATAQIVMPTIRRRRRSGVAGAAGGVSSIVTGSKVKRARTELLSGEGSFVERPHHGERHRLRQERGGDRVDLVGGDRVDPGQQVVHAHQIAVQELRLG